MGDEHRLSGYQMGALGQLIRLEKLLELVNPPAPARTVVFSGTLPVVDGTLRYERLFEGALSDLSGRTLSTVAYQTVVLDPSPLILELAIVALA